MSEITFKSHGQRSGGYRGDCRFVWSSGSEEEFRYETHQKALEIVLRKLSGNFQNERLLKRIEKDGFKIKEMPLLAADEARVYQKPSGQRRGYTPNPFEPPGWWICHDTSSEQKCEFIKRAAELANVQIAWDQSRECKYGF